MSLPAIEVSGLSKRYVIQHESRHDNLRDTLHHTARKLWRRFRWGTGFSTEEFWALRDVSFTIQPGEVVGIIGRNGAGKSTLLKILSRITEPTSGKVKLRGRVASLLEVGTGFHPELTGRENIFLNGAILGMSRGEIRKKFDEIVAFAEVERFLDTPVKRYSSGMYVRLAFAVAAHLEPEILIVDEVLAVGDAAFQKKCINKMEEVSRRENRTVLFVSHNTEAVSSLCTSCILLEHGRVKTSGDTARTIADYLGAGQNTSSRVRFSQTDKPAQLVEAYLSVPGSSREGAYRTEDTITINTHISVRRPITGLEVSLSVMNFKRERLFYTSHVETAECRSVEHPGEYLLSATLPRNLLLPGRYVVNLGLHRPNIELYDYKPEALSFELLRASGDAPPFTGSALGLVHADVTWACRSAG